LIPPLINDYFFQISNGSSIKRTRGITISPLTVPRAKVNQNTSLCPSNIMGRNPQQVQAMVINIVFDLVIIVFINNKLGDACGLIFFKLLKSVTINKEEFVTRLHKIIKAA
jgi:hypothetical protein